MRLRFRSEMNASIRAESLKPQATSSNASSRASNNKRASVTDMPKLSRATMKNGMDKLKGYVKTMQGPSAEIDKTFDVGIFTQVKFEKSRKSERNRAVQKVFDSLCNNMYPSDDMSKFSMISNSQRIYQITSFLPTLER